MSYLFQALHFVMLIHFVHSFCTSLPHQTNSSMASLKEGINTSKAMLREILTHLPASCASSPASFSSDSFGTVGTSAPAQPFMSDLTPAKTTPPTHVESL